FASIGLWYSARCRTTLRATAWTIATAILAGGGHWLCMGMCCYMPVAMLARGDARFWEYLMVGELGLTPPYIFGWDPFREFSQLNNYESHRLMPLFAAVGVLTWSIAALIIGTAAKNRFEKLTHRNEHERPSAPPVVVQLEGASRTQDGEERRHLNEVSE